MIIFMVIIAIIKLESGLSYKVNGLCGIPGYSSISPENMIYQESSVIEQVCSDPKLQFLKWHQKCVKNNWINVEDIPEHLCSAKWIYNEHSDEVLLIDENSKSIKYRNLSNLNLELTDDIRFEWKFNKEIEFQFISVMIEWLTDSHSTHGSIHILNTSRIYVEKSSTFSNIECNLTGIHMPNSLIFSCNMEEKMKNDDFKFNKIEFWPVSNQNINLTFMHLQFLDIKSPIYNYCGIPKAPYGSIIVRNESSQEITFYVKCADGFEDLNTTPLETYEITCSNSKYLGDRPECVPKITCPKFDSTYDIESYSGVYYLNDFLWYAFNGTTAYLRCESKTHTSVTKILTCLEDGKWSDTAYNCSKSSQNASNPQNCNTDKENDGDFGVSNWPSVRIGDFSYILCPNGNGHAFRECLPNGKLDSNPNWTQCYEWLNELTKLKNSNDILRITQIMSINTRQNNSIINGEILNEMIDILQKIKPVLEKEKFDQKYTDAYTSNIITILSNMINQKYAWLNSTIDNRIEMASQILFDTQYFSFSLLYKQNKSDNYKQFKSDQIYLSAFSTDQNREIIFPQNKSLDENSIHIPEGFEINGRENVGNFKSFGAIIDGIQDYLLSGVSEHKQINSVIVSFSFDNQTETVKLNKEVKIRLKHKEKLHFGDQIQCNFWDFNSSLWSSKGCYKSIEESDLYTTVCKCDHLTNFAALIDSSGRQDNNIFKSISSYCCSGLSIAGLVLTVLLQFKPNKSGNRNLKSEKKRQLKLIIICNLCICLSIVNILVVFGMNRVDYKWLCQLLSGLLLYSLMSSIFWMLLEGYQLYKSLVLIFDSEFSKLRIYAVGYGVPFIICLISFLIIWLKENILIEALFDERYNHFCWISSERYQNHIWILIGPALTVVFMNMIITFISFRKAFKGRKRINSHKKETNQKIFVKFMRIFSFICLIFLLGINWITFLLYMYEFMSFLSYFFIYFNGLQGFFIFIYHFFLSMKEIRKA